MYKEVEENMMHWTKLYSSEAFEKELVRRNVAPLRHISDTIEGHHARRNGDITEAAMMINTFVLAKQVVDVLLTDTASASHEEFFSALDELLCLKGYRIEAHQLGIRGTHIQIIELKERLWNEPYQAKNHLTSE